MMISQSVAQAYSENLKRNETKVSKKKSTEFKKNVKCVRDLRKNKYLQISDSYKEMYGGGGRGGGEGWSVYPPTIKSL